MLRQGAPASGWVVDELIGVNSIGKLPIQGTVCFAGGYGAFAVRTMKKLYEAQNSIEAHMILNLLQQAGIEGRVDGEYLQGGIGELPVSGLVRVMVSDRDFDSARSIIGEWEAREKPIEKNDGPGRTGVFNGFVLGALVGGAIVWWVHNTPHTEDGVDHNRDGETDEWHVYKDGKIHRVDIDRNFDGNIDAVHDYNRHGIIHKSNLDDDFDGVYESMIKYKRGQPIVQETDTDGDGGVDYRIMAEHGVLKESEIIDPSAQSVVKRQHFRIGKLVSADFDSNRDGKMDTEYHYDFFEEIEDRIFTGE